VTLFFSGYRIDYDGVVIAVARPPENVYNPIAQKTESAKWTAGVCRVFDLQSTQNRDLCVLHP
jgi:hypothetical protein